MSRKTVIVSKSGSVVRFNGGSRVRSNSERNGEVGETEGLLLHLSQRNDCDIVYFGRWSGDPSHIPNIRFVPSNIEYVKEFLKSDTYSTDPRIIQERGFAADRELMGDVNAVGFLNLCGYSPSRSTVGYGPTCQATAVNYLAPQLAMMQHLKTPRICFVTDPRCYPRDGEMSTGWSWCRPQGLIGQYLNGRRFKRSVIGVSYSVSEIYGRLESWGRCNEPSDSTRPIFDRVPGVCVAHSHVGAGLAHSSFERWVDVFEGAPEFFVVWGDGWDNSPFDRKFFAGSCAMWEVADVLHRGYFCPVVPHTRGYATGKPYVVTAAKTVPILTPDYEGWDHCPFPRITDNWRADCCGYEERLQWWTEQCRPDFSIVDRIIDDLLSGDFEDGKYGSYSRSSIP